MTHTARPHPSRLLAIVLVLALLCAQWMGLEHRVVHADGQTAASLSTPLENGAGDGVHHSCALLDAAALGAGVQSAPFTLPLLASVRVFALWIAFASWSAPFTCHFSSRAPPLS